MRRRKKEVSVITIILTCVFFIFSPSSEENSQTIPSEKRFILIVNLSVLNCPFCVQSLTEFIGTINAFKLESAVLGVLVFSQRENGLRPETQVKIAEKRLRGFILGNEIQFPFFLDRRGVFDSMNPDGTAALILFDRNESVVKRYTFPLTSAQIKEVYRE